MPEDPHLESSPSVRHQTQRWSIREEGETSMMAFETQARQLHDHRVAYRHRDHRHLGGGGDRPFCARRSRAGERGLQVLKSLPQRGARPSRFALPRIRRRLAPRSSSKADGSEPVGEDEVEPASGYTFASEGVTTDTYTIIATPPKTDMITYTLNETGAVTP